MSWKLTSRRRSSPASFAIASSAGPRRWPWVTAASPIAVRLRSTCFGSAPAPERSKSALTEPSSIPAAPVNAERNWPARTLSARPLTAKPDFATSKLAVPLIAPP